jgi:hypothetical protein
LVGLVVLEHPGGKVGIAGERVRAEVAEVLRDVTLGADFPFVPDRSIDRANVAAEMLMTRGFVKRSFNSSAFIRTFAQNSGSKIPLGRTEDGEEALAREQFAIVFLVVGD